MEAQIKEARMIVHRMAGLLTGASAGLECCAMAGPKPRVYPYIAKVSDLLREAQDELVCLQSVLRSLSEEDEEA